MSAAMFQGLRLVPDEQPTRSSPSERGWLGVGGLLFALVALVLALAPRWSDRRGLRALPAEERAALLARTVDELGRTCGPARPDALADHCRELAAFAARFDECQGACAALVRRELTPVPTR